MGETEESLLFGQRVMAMRERRGLTQQELAQQAGTSYQTIWRIERGLLKAPNVFLAARIAKALSASLDYLAGIYDERARCPLHATAVES